MKTLFRAVAAGVATVLLCPAMAQSPPPAGPAIPHYGAWGLDLTTRHLATRPGDDFFRHANGAWFDRSVIPSDLSAVGVDVDLELAVEAQLRDIVEKGPKGEEGETAALATKISTFYASFMDQARIEALDAHPIAPMLAAISAVTSREAFAELMGSSSTTPYSSIFARAVGSDYKAPDQHMLSIGQGGLGLPDRDYYLQPQFAPKVAAYRAYIARMLRLIAWDKPDEMAAAILAFETRIAEASWSNVDERDSEKLYNPMSVAELEAAAPFPWRRFLKAAKLGDVERVVVAEVTAVPKIAAIYAGTDLATLKAWQAFHVIDWASPRLSKRFVDANFDFRSRELQGIQQLSERWKMGVAQVNASMGEAVGRIYVGRYFPPQAKAQIDALVALLRVAFQHRIERVEWMSDDTRAKALEKLARLNVKIAYPRKWRDYSTLEVKPDDLLGNVLRGMQFDDQHIVDQFNLAVDRDEWGMTPQTINAYYSSNLNEIVFPAAILQPPFFDPSADPAVNYGGIGAVIGHEMTHGFDDDGRKFDGFGALSNWWTHADIQEFSTRTGRLGRQYDAFEPYPGVHVNGDLTMGENIADLGGALIALDGYRLSLQGKPAPVVDGLSGDQRFFLSFAQSWRGKSTEEAIRQQVASNPHSPAQFRVNGVVRNIDDWYAAFAVPVDGKLYLAPADRVRIW